MPDPRPEPPKELVGAVVDAAKALVAVWENSVAPLEGRISAAQLRVLLFVDHVGDATMGTLSDELGMIPSSTSRLCDRLEAAGLLRRYVGHPDGRSVTVRLTPAGQRMANRVWDDRVDGIARVLTRMPPTKRRALLVGLAAFDSAAGGNNLREKRA